MDYFWCQRAEISRSGIGTAHQAGTLGPEQVRGGQFAGQLRQHFFVDSIHSAYALNGVFGGEGLSSFLELRNAYLRLVRIFWRRAFLSEVVMINGYSS